MISMIVTLTKYLIIFLMLLYTFSCFTVFNKKTEKKRKKVLRKQFVLILLLLLVTFFAMFVQTMDIQLLILYGEMTAYVIVVQFLYRLIYKKASVLLLNNMCMLMSIGIIVIARLRFSLAEKQFLLIVAGTGLSLLVPVIVRKVKLLRDLTWVYCVAGIAMLMAVLVLARVSGGAKLSVAIVSDGPTFQLSEVVKIIYVFFLAGMLVKDISFKNIAISTILAAVHVCILAVSKDLGTALVFFVAYLVLVFVATKNPLYSFAGLAGGSLAAVGAYHVMAHVRVRVMAWKDPFYDPSNASYQVVQGLFAICAGGWFGTGLYQGAADTIPVATQDYIFAAICEELGGIFGICLVLVCMSCFLMIVNISMRLSKRFYKLVALGLGAEYAFQVFLNIGGNIKFIPLTGITLPLVSYGGSSIICSIMMFAIIQGLYILRDDEQEQRERERAEAALKAREQLLRQEQLQENSRRRRGNNVNDEEKTLEEKIREQTEKSLNW